MSVQRASSHCYNYNTLHFLAVPILGGDGEEENCERWPDGFAAACQPTTTVAAKQRRSPMSAGFDIDGVLLSTSIDNSRPHNSTKLIILNDCNMYTHGMNSGLKQRF